MSVHNEIKRITTHTLQEMKRKGEKIACLTSYDYSMAKIVDAAGVELILVGDSASNVMAGYETTLPITLDNMIYHAQAVVKGVKRALVVVDLPFGSYQGNSEEALRSAIRIMKESGGHAVKLEGGIEIKESIERILSAGIPVMGHLGLTPQSIYKFGTYAVRAKEEEEAEQIEGYCLGRRGEYFIGLRHASKQGCPGLGNEQRQHERKHDQHQIIDHRAEPTEKITTSRFEQKCGDKQRAND